MFHSSKTLAWLKVSYPGARLLSEWIETSDFLAFIPASGVSARARCFTLRRSSVPSMWIRRRIRLVCLPGDRGAGRDTPPTGWM